MLFIDPNNTGKITEANQVIFTDWDPTAKNDMQALEDVFDTNHDGKLDAGDAAFSQFKLMVTNADGTTTVETLAQAGITSIDLNANSVNQSFTDGSSIDGETTFTKSDGTTGTAATVTFATDANGYAVKTTTTHNADGSTTIDNAALNADGSLANETISTTSADGLSRTISYDDAGNGIIDHVQTDVTVDNADGSTTETLSNRNGAGVFENQTITTTSADGNRAHGFDGRWRLRSDASVADARQCRRLDDDHRHRGECQRLAARPGGDGALGQRPCQDDRDGFDRNGVFDTVSSDVTVVNGDGSRTETVTDRSANGNLLDQTVTVIGADGRSRNVQADTTGDGPIDHTETIVVASGSVDTASDFNADGSLKDQTVTTTSADGLTKTVQTDSDGRWGLRPHERRRHGEERRRLLDHDGHRDQCGRRAARPDRA